ncbi:MAG: helix-turn-helix transcriptional regulator [Beutenbergiaceae bacterium]
MNAPGDGRRDPGAPGRREQVLQAVTAAEDPIGIADLADRLQIHPNTVRFHLDHLTVAGRVEAVETQAGGPGRPPRRYRAVRSMDHTGPRNYQLLARVLIEGMADLPDPIPLALAAGQRWGEQVAQAEPDRGDPVGQVVGLLGEAGFDPAQTESGIDLHHCPFLDLSANGDRTVCAVHLGLMQGALRGWDSDVDVDHLEPFAQADVCRAHLKPSTQPCNDTKG